MLCAARIKDAAGVIVAADVQDFPLIFAGKTTIILLPLHQKSGVAGAQRSSSQHHAQQFGRIQQGPKLGSAAGHALAGNVLQRRDYQIVIRYINEFLQGFVWLDAV
jgi:hypothetical protein